MATWVLFQRISSAGFLYLTFSLSLSLSLSLSPYVAETSTNS